MAVESTVEAPEAEAVPVAETRYLQLFWLYETQSKYYLIGRDMANTLWRVLKIDRLEPSELNIREDSTKYSESECNDLLKRVHEGNKSTGGLKLVTACYGIVGFVKFLGPYYMLIITERKEVGTICGHMIYAITKSEMIALTNPTLQSPMINSKDENRYKKLLCTMDLTKDFFFSYSYHIMRNLQKNLCDGESGQLLYDTMFVWNEFLTRGIRTHLKNTMWTVALVYGFFKQASLSISGKNFNLTLIARRSRHFAGTRYLKRGVNEKGRVANDVETEQIVSEDICGGRPSKITSVVQNRGSIPLFWSQGTSVLNIKPDIILNKQGRNYEATRLHFENLVKRYGKPIVVLNLIKFREKKPREFILREEFANAIDTINKDLSHEDHLKFLHWDISRHTSNANNLIRLLGKMTEIALDLTGFFYCRLTPDLCFDGTPSFLTHVNDKLADFQDDRDKGVGHGFTLDPNGPPMFQKGVLRTNCIDCLDRTNVAQYAYGLAALGRQLHTLGFMDCPKINTSLSGELMNIYEAMGDTLAMQYGGSPAHNKIFSDLRGQSKAATQYHEFMRTCQRYCSNAYMDSEKQDAINVFLGYFQPQIGKPALWELDSDQHYSIGRAGQTFTFENGRSYFLRSFSEGNILFESKSPFSSAERVQKNLLKSSLARRMRVVDSTGLSDSAPDISTSQCEISCISPGILRKIFMNRDRSDFEEPPDNSTWSNFLDLDSLSSPENSCEEISERSILLNSLYGDFSSENVINGTPQTTPALSEQGSGVKVDDSQYTGVKDPPLNSYESDQISRPLGEFSEYFVNWVDHGEAFCH